MYVGGHRFGLSYLAMCQWSSKMSRVCAIVLAFLGSTAAAAPITPTFDTFGSLPAATFGGSGIPNNAVAISTVSDGGKTFTLGLSVAQRYSNPVVANDGAGTFFVETGANNGTPGQAGSHSTWNLNFYGNASSGSLLASGYLFRLLYDFDPSIETDSSDHGVLIGTDLGSTVQGSENLTSLLPWALSAELPPTSFDPNANGEYTFALQLLKVGGPFWNPSLTLLDTVAIRVVAQTAGQPAPTPAPEPTSLALLSLGGLGLAGRFVRRRRKQNAA